MGRLIDDGTLDTVIQCELCGHRERYMFQATEGDVKYEDFVKDCLGDFDSEHECKEGEEVDSE